MEYNRRQRGAFAVRALVLVLPAALVLSGCVATPEGGITNSSSPSELIPVPASGAPTTSAPLETAQTSNKAPVYWIGRSNDNAFLYREFRDVPDQDNPVTRALRVMMSQQPLDPDFFTPWQNPKKLATSISGTNVITVDVSADAFNSNVDAAMAERAIQQLVYTATAAAASAGLIDSGQQVQVVILVDGHTDYVAFNHVRLGTPTSRSAGLVAPVWIIDPQEGDSVTDGPVKINGRSTVQGGKLRWENPQGRRRQRQDRLSQWQHRCLGRCRAARVVHAVRKPRPGHLRGPGVPGGPGRQREGTVLRHPRLHGQIIPVK